MKRREFLRSTVASACAPLVAVCSKPERDVVCGLDLCCDTTPDSVSVMVAAIPTVLADDAILKAQSQAFATLEWPELEIVKCEC